jgi:transcription initiation protein SPT3
MSLTHERMLLQHFHLSIRQAFREWAGIGLVTDEVVDTWGFLTQEIVQTLTEEAFRVRAAEDLQKAGTAENGPTERGIKKRKRECEVYS